MSKGNTFENDLLKLIFQGVAIADIAENDATSPLTAYWLGLHTADPGEAGDQTTNETAYTGYARKSINRASGAGGFTVTANSVSPTDDVDFDPCTASPGGNLTHFSLGTASSGAGKILYKGTLTPNVVMGVGVIPRFKNTSTITED